jgi:hypothetical protein
VNNESGNTLDSEIPQLDTKNWSPVVGGDLSSGAAAPGAPTRSPESLARRRGKDWALPSRSVGEVAYLRPVRIFCSENEIVIQSGASLNNQQTTIKFDGPTVSAVQPLVDAIWRMIDSWGIAGTNGYWKPELRVSVLPGGQQRLNELQTLLDESGFIVRGDQ